jgi:hypothetical protein
MTRIVVAGSILGLVCLAGVARGGSYAEQTAATGIHNTLASSGGNSARSILDTVNRNLPKVSTPDFEKPFSGHSGGAKGKSGGGGAGGKGSWASGGSGSSSKSPAGKGWATASSASGRGAAGGKSAWESSKSSAGKGEGWASATDKTHPATRRR